MDTTTRDSVAAGAMRTWAAIAADIIRAVGEDIPCDEVVELVSDQYLDHANKAERAAWRRLTQDERDVVLAETFPHERYGM